MGQLERERQNGTAEQERQSGTGRTGKIEWDRQNREDRMGLAEQERQNWTGRRKEGTGRRIGKTKGRDRT
jgi:hypothetical protein